MVQQVYGLTVDFGDGSNNGIRWFRSLEIVDQLLDDNDLNVEYYGNEGSPAVTLTFPDDLDLAAAGFQFSDASYE